MAQYIDKDAVVAKIKRNLKNINLNYVSVGSHSSDSVINKKLQDGISKTLQSLLSFINTLEVKEVDLEKEISYDDYMGFFEKHPNFPDDWGYDEARIFANYFFKLGLKAKNIDNE